MSRSFELPDAQWATVGAIGEPGQRTFYLQVRQDQQLLTLKLEKQQVGALAEFLIEILSDLPAPGPKPVEPALVEPAMSEWPVGSLQLAYDAGTDRIVILAEEIAPDPEDPNGAEAEVGAARIGITRETAASIARVGAELVAAGRPPCPLCGRPMDPEGHSCPRTNGHHP